MTHISAKARAVITCAAVVIMVAACGAPDPGTATPDTGPDLLQALPGPTSTPPAPSALLSPTTAAAPTTKAKPTPAPRRNGAAADPSAKGKPSAKAKPSPAAPAPQWRRVGGDEFNGAALDTGSWNAYKSKGGFGTGLRRPEAISLSDGMLNITAKGDVSGGMGHTFGQLHGRWEFRARTERGRGLGSAVLLWPDSEKWPRDGEVDIMEVPGENRDRAHFVLHWGEANHVHGSAVSGDFSQWHTFAVEWLPDRVTWFVDGVKQYENTDKAAIPTTPMHLTIQLDQGPKKDWIPARDESTPEEVAFQVDWVRIYAAS